MLHLQKQRGRAGRSIGTASPRHLGGDAQPPDVAANLRRIRHESGYSLERLAKLSGVSRAMLGQIETGKSVPTITLVWKVAKALGISAAALIADPVEARTVVLPKGAVRTLSLSNGRFQLHSFSTAAFTQPFDFCEVFIAPGHREEIAALPFGTSATLALTSGTLEIAVGEELPAMLLEQAVVLFQADIAHSFFNPDRVDATAFLVMARGQNASG
ncbi:MAG: helix-turn-helix transcriptional regulator [Hyphomicrobium sp.]